MNKMKKGVAFLLALIFVTVTAVLPTTAAATPLPGGVLIVDEDGFQPDATSGTYYLQVADMLPGQTYTKQIHVQNFDVANTFHIYMKAEPVSSVGDIALFDEVTLELLLDGTQIYTGSPNGIGNIDMQTDSVDLGAYATGQQRQLTCNVTLSSEVGNPGHDGESGSIDFKWIFTAVQDSTPKPPDTGDIVQTSFIVFFSALTLSVVLFAIQKKRREKEGTADEP